jgi:hypothetical protein
MTRWQFALSTACALIVHGQSSEGLVELSVAEASRKIRTGAVYTAPLSYGSRRLPRRRCLARAAGLAGTDFGEITSGRTIRRAKLRAEFFRRQSNPKLRQRHVPVRFQPAAFF